MGLKPRALAQQGWWLQQLRCHGKRRGAAQRDAARGTAQQQGESTADRMHGLTQRSMPSTAWPSVPPGPWPSEQALKHGSIVWDVDNQHLQRKQGTAGSEAHPGRGRHHALWLGLLQGCGGAGQAGGALHTWQLYSPARGGCEQGWLIVHAAATFTCPSGQKRPSHLLVAGQGCPLHPPERQVGEGASRGRHGWLLLRLLMLMRGCNLVVFRA